MNNPIAPPKPKSSPATIRGLLEGDAFKAAVGKALPRHLPPDRFIRVALTALMRTPKLAECDQGSFFQAMLTLSQLGLEPDGRRAHLIPFENRKRGVTECQLIIDYKGLVDLAMRSGAISNIHADVVCENDEFEFDRGELLHHRINFREPRGRVFAVYAICRFKDGSEKAEVMTRAEVEAIRARSRAKDAGPWVTDWNEMAKKTVFRRLSKWLPLSAEFRDAAEADADQVEDRRVEIAKPVFEAQTFLPPPPAFAAPAFDPTPAPAPTPPEPEPEPAPPPPEEVFPDERVARKTEPPQREIEREAGAPVLSPAHVELQAFLAEHGIGFPALQTWALEIGWEAGFDSYGSIADLPPRSVQRLLRATGGLLKAFPGVEEVTT